MTCARQNPKFGVPRADVVPVFSKSIGSWQFSIGRRGFARTELVEHYDNESKTWGQKISRLGFERAYLTLLRKVFRQQRYAPSAGDLCVLDAGIGTGAMALAFCSVAKGAVRLDGIDISSAMLAQAARRLQRKTVDLTLHQADILALPYEDNTFDVVLVAHVLEHLAEPEKAISELYRVLKPGGVLVTCVTRRSSVGAYIQLIWRTHQVDMSVALDWLRQVGFDSARAVPLDRGSIARRFSIGYVARKPS